SASGPTAPTIRVRAPRRAAAAAWFAPLPPGDRDSRPPPTVSPGAGRRSVLAVMSALMLPTTVSAQSMVITTIIVRGRGNGRDQNRLVGMTVVPCVGNNGSRGFAIGVSNGT